MAAPAIPDLKTFLADKDKQRTPAAPQKAGPPQQKIPDLREFLASKEKASPVSIDALKNKFQTQNTKQPESDFQFGLKKLKELYKADPVGDYLFGKKQTPAASNAGPSINAADNGVLGKLWDDVRLLPTGTGRNIGEVTEAMFNPLGRTDLQQQVREDEREAAYKKRTEGMGTTGKVGAAALEGVEENLEGQLSPFNLGLLFLSSGESVAKEAPSAMMATLGKLAHLGFTAQMTLGTVDAAEASVDAFKRGDYESGVKLAVSGLISGVMARSGLHDIDAQQNVKIALDKKAQQLHQRKFADLDPKQQAQTVYEATKAMPLHAELGGADDFIERAKRQGFQPPVVSDQLGERLEKTLASGVQPLAPLPAATPEGFKAGRDFLQVMRKEASDANRQAAADDFREKVRAEMSRIPSPEKTSLPDQPTVLNVPVYSPWEREGIRYENQKAAAMRVIETERAAEQARQDREAQLADDARRRSEDTEQEAARRSGQMEVTDRRSQPEIHQQILNELGERENLRSEVGRMYEQHVAALSQMTDGMGFRSTDLAANLIRSKRERGTTLSPEENSVLAMHAKREELIRKLADTKPATRKMLDEHLATQDAETVRNVVAFTERETALRDAAHNLEEQARFSGTPEAADLLSRQAIEARQMAEKVITDRERAQAAQIARHEEKQVVLRGPSVPYTLGGTTEVHLPDGRALKARYAAIRLSELILSHDPFSFQWNEKYEPRRMQPRDLGTNENAQAAILIDSKPENYRLERYLTDNPTGLEGPAVILPDGRVAGGNSRLSRLSRRLAEADGRELSAAIAAQFPKFGIAMEDLYDPADPYIPVRVLDDVPETTQDLIQLGQDLNRDTIMGFSPEEQGVMNADRLTQDDVDQIAAMIESLPGEASIRDVLRWRGQQVMDMMVRSGIIPENKRAEFMTQTGELTEKAKDAFESAILGKVINDPNLIATTPPSIMNKVERTLPSLMRLKSAAPEWEISDYLKDAMRIWKQIDSIRPSLNLIGKDSDSIVDKYFEPEKFPMGTGLMSFGEEEVRPKPHPITHAIVRALDKKALDVKKAFEDYAAPAEGKQSFLLAPPEPYQAFNDTIGRLGDSEVHPVDWGTVLPATPEQKAIVDRAMEPETKPNAEEQKAAQEMTMPPNVNIAAKNVLTAVQEGTVTPAGLRDLFGANPSTAEHADALMEILGRIIPNATGESLSDFLGKHLADVSAGEEGVDAKKGMTHFLDDGRAIVKLFEKADPSTVLHEFTHVMRRFLANEGDRYTLEKFAGVEHGLWDTTSEEKVARAFERYMHDGEAPLAELRGLFEKMKQIFREIYGYIRNGKYRIPKESPINIKLSKDVKATFDRWFVGDRKELAPTPSSDLSAFTKEQRSALEKHIAGKKLKGKEYEALDSIPFDSLPLEYFAENVRPAIDYFRKHPDLDKALNGETGVDAAIAAWREVPKEITNRTISVNRFTEPQIDELVSKLTQREAEEWAKSEHADSPTRDALARRLKEMRRNVASFTAALSSGAEWRDVGLAAIQARELIDEHAGPLEMAPPPSSLSEVVTPGEREEAVLRANGGNSIADRLAESRLKRFPSLDEAKAWTINNREKFHGIELYELPNGEAFANFVPKDAKTLFQSAEPQTLAEMIRRVEQIKGLLQRETRPEVRERMMADIRRLDAKIGVPSEMILAATPDQPKPLIVPPDLRPEPKPGQVELLFGGDREKTDESRRLPDAAAELPERGRAGKVADLRERPASDGAVQGTAGAAGDRGRGVRESDRGSLRAVRSAALATPKRMRGEATVAPEKWAKRMSDLGMPEGLPAPTVKLDDDLQSLLIFPGQAEVVESTLSALDQFDGTIIATPTGTGKSYTVMATIKQMMRSQGAERVLVLTKNDSIINGKRKGLKDIGKNTFNLEVQDIPKNLKKSNDGIYATTYATLRNRPDLYQVPWDLVIYDEAAEAANWQNSKQGQAVRLLNNATAKAVYVSATPFATAVELGYMSKLGMWESGKFPEFAKQFGVFENRDGKLVGGNEPKKLLKLREQLIERGQFVTQEKSMEGFTANFAQVPLSPEQHQTMKGIITAMKEAAMFYDLQQKPELARAVRGNMATFVKSYLERIRLPQTIEVVKKMRDQGWKVLIFSETRASVDKMYDFLKEADEASGGRLGKSIPRLPGVYEEIAKAFGEDQVANFSGPYSPKREAEKESFDSGEKPILFATYGAGGVGVSLHDDRGTSPRAAVYLGPPWSGKMFDQAMGRAWRYGTKSNVFATFMVSNAVPETRMILTKVAPRLESLRAAVEGVSNDPMVERMRNLGYNREELARYEMGSGGDTPVEEMLTLDDEVSLSNYKDMAVPAAAQAMHKGMKYPGQVDDRPGVIQLFQADGTVIVPDRFRTPEDRRAEGLNEEIAQSLTDGGSVPGVGTALSGYEAGTRKQIADEIGPQVADLLEEPTQADPAAVARIAWQNELTKIAAAKAAGEILPNAGDGPAWNIRTPGPPESLVARPEKMEEKTPVTRDVRPLNWVLSGRNNLVRVARQAGVPEVGVKLRWMRDEYQTVRANVAGDLQARYMRLLQDNKITPKESRVLFMVKEGKLPPPNERIAKAVEDLTKLTLDAHHLLAARGWKGTFLEDGEMHQFDFSQMSDDPRYAPHKHNLKEKISLTDTTTGNTEEFTLQDLLGKSLSEARRERILSSIESATGTPRARIEDWLDRKRRRVPLAGNLERARQADLPFYRMDSNVWMEYFEQVGEAVARADVFGQNREKLDAEIVQIPSVKGRQVVSGIFDGVLSKLPWDQELGKWYSRWGTAQVLSKMTFSAAKVPFHLAHTAVVMENIGSLTKSLFQGVTNYGELKERALFAGVLVDQMKAGAMMEQAAGAKAANAMLKYEGFHWFYSFDRIVSNAAAQNWMERYALPRLTKGAKSADHIRTQLREKFLMSDKEIDAAVERGRWSQEDLNRGGAALTNRTLFTTDPTELAPAWRARSKENVHESIGAAVRIATILKGFTFKTAMLIKEDILDEAKRGNYRPLAYAMMVYPVIGEALQAASAASRTVPAALTGNVHHNALTKYASDLEALVKDPGVAKLLHRYIDDLAHATALTVLSQAVDTLFFPPKNKRSARFRVNKLAQDEVSWLAGPYADVVKTADAAYHVLGALTVEEGEKRFSQAWKATEGWAREEFPALRTIFPEKKEQKPQLAKP